MLLDPTRVQAIFLSAVECHDPAARAAILDHECTTHPELRRRVEGLLSVYDQAGSHVDRPIVLPEDDWLEGTGDGSPIGASDEINPTIDRLPDADSTSAGGAPSVMAGRAIPAISGYEILGELGRGGMGVVYRARQVRLNRPCALKMILGGAHASPEMDARFLAEAEAVARLQHPNVVRIHTIGEDDGLPFFELEFLDGGSLDRRLDGTPWPARRAAGLVEPVARGVAEAHRQGIVHRDLKPGNVLLAADGTPKVTDFGLAKSLAADSGLTRTDSIMGSPSYMSPEQAEGKTRDVGPLADVYSLGAILYELLTGGPPFRGTTALEVIDQVKNTEPVPPSRLVPGLPRDVETIALKCLQKEPGKRYESATALAEDLKRFIEGRPIEARPVPFWERGWRWTRRNPWLAGATGSTAVALLLALALAILSADQNARIADEQTRANTKISGMNVELTRKGDDLERSLAKANLNLAMFGFERGQSLFERGRVGEGLLWLVKGWQSAAAAGDPGWQHTARASIAAWQSHVFAVKAVFSHQGRVTAVAFSPDGKAVLTGSDDQTARLWDTLTGRPIGPPLTHQGVVWSVAFSPDGKAVLTGSYDQTARLWDAATGRPIGPPLAHQGVVTRVAFSPDAKAVLTGSADKTARLWDAATGRPIGPPLPHQDQVSAVAFSPDAKVVLTAGRDQTARLWDAATGWPIGPPLAHQGMVFAVAFSPDGKAVLTGSWDQTARLWDAATGRPIGPPLLHQGVINAVAFSPDGKAVLTGSADKTARLWDAATGRPIGPPLEHQGAVWSVAFSPDGKAVLTGSEDKTARLWDAATGQAHRASHGPPGRGLCRGVQPRRQGRTHRQRRPDGAALGRGDGAGPSGLPCPPGPGPCRGVQPRRQGRTHRQP